MVLWWAGDILVMILGDEGAKEMKRTELPRHNNRSWWCLYLSLGIVASSLWDPLTYVLVESRERIVARETVEDLYCTGRMIRVPGI